MTARISLRGVSCGYAGKTVLSGVDLDLFPGECAIITGPSGGGKSTLARVAAGLVRPFSGTVVRTAARVGIVFQEPRLLPWRTALENVMLPFAKATPEAEEKAGNVLRIMGLAGAEHMYPAQLSGGMRQRVSMARALAVEPDLLILDEPFTGLDTELRGRLKAFLEAALLGKGVAVLQVTHCLDDVLAGPRRVYALQKGMLLPAEIATSGFRLREAPGFCGPSEPPTGKRREKARGSGQCAPYEYGLAVDAGSEEHYTSRSILTRNKENVMPHINTICVQGGYKPGNGEPRAVPIIQSTTFKYDSSQEMAKLFNLEKSGYFYSRLQNPTCDNVAAKIAQLEGGTAAVLTGSGQAANFFATFNICPAGGHLICTAEIYGGTFNLFNTTMRQMGVETTFVRNSCTDEELEAAFRPNTKAVVGETISNPTMTVLDIERFARVAHAHGVPLIVDNTFPTPVNCRPFEWGADIVTHSTTKYMDGHSSSVGGVVVDSGNFDWTKYPEKFPGLCTPDESYHGLVYTERFGIGVAFITKAVAHLMRDLGSVQAPFNAFIVNLGLESLHVRIKRHCENGEAVAAYLAKHPKVAYVKYCSLPGNDQYELARKYMPNGSCGVVSFGVRGGREKAETFMNRLTRCNIATHVSDAYTCILHPASSTHRQLTDEQLRIAGVQPEFVRLSVGIEDVADIIEDLDQALAQI